MRCLNLIILLLLSSCIPEPEMDNGGKDYYLKAYLFEGQKVTEVHVKRVLKYLPVVDDSVDQLLPQESWVKDAKVTLFLDDQPIPLTLDYYSDRNYESDHIVKAGGHYKIQAEIFDTLTGKMVVLTAETVCPAKDTTIRLDKDTMYIDSSLIENEFWDMYKTPENFPHFTLTMAPSDQYQMLSFAGSGTSVVETWMPTFLKRNPLLATQMIISPIHFQSHRFYSQYWLVVNHLNKEYANIYVYNGPESDVWLHGNTDLVPEGISNVSNGGGIFTAVSSDTLKFYLKKKL